MPFEREELVRLVSTIWK